MDCRLYRNGLMLALLYVAVTQQQTVQAQENWRDSLTAINKQIAQSSWSTDLHLRKANANLQLKQWQYAVDEYGLVLQKEPHNPTPICVVSTWRATISATCSLCCPITMRHGCQWLSYNNSLGVSRRL